MIQLETSLNDLYSKKSLDINFNSGVLLDKLLDNPSIHSFRKKMEKKTVLINEGEKTNSIYYIEIGIVKKTHANQTIGFQGEGSFQGMSTLIMNEEANMSSIVFETSYVIEFRRCELLEYILSMQEGWLFLFLIEKEEQRMLLEKIAQNQYHGTDRMKYILLNLASKFGVSVEGNTKLPSEFNRDSLSDYTCYSPATMTNLIKQLHREKFLAPTGRQQPLKILKE
ncbi:hypothetical protein C1903_02950 [Listeria ivanovii]|uniref:Crp/Fnr family transcriptional regulator n=1 Tax=Listeria ivanovii TaxID=1638 RepID=UPI000DA862D2|nr:Crp/Fnr family transcriptional regulator [Listeria ivanovii]PZF90526.1 hypothetical protein C1905_03020 [Listeria ivanovii]PZF95912.1 hypothetical protein C1903_02950 [Listeria ivanovii]PZG06162.1 hypothetical protein C2L88_02945 [Listeria ivanovii]PZG11055.1 hypothetical protein C1901_03180 [Listeria ivanovii]PZG28050.1 hypothetical protein C1900_03025 [Listeria ivanovii]